MIKPSKGSNHSLWTGQLFFVKLHIHSAIIIIFGWKQILIFIGAFAPALFTSDFQDKLVAFWGGPQTGSNHVSLAQPPTQVIFNGSVFLTVFYKIKFSAPFYSLASKYDLLWRKSKASRNVDKIWKFSWKTFECKFDPAWGNGRSVH